MYRAQTYASKSILNSTEYGLYYMNKLYEGTSASDSGWTSSDEVFSAQIDSSFKYIVPNINLKIHHAEVRDSAPRFSHADLNFFYFKTVY